MSTRRWRTWFLVLGLCVAAVLAHRVLLPGRVGSVEPPGEVGEARPPLLPRPAGTTAAAPQSLGDRQELLVVFFVDGLSSDAFRAAVEAGQLPAVDRITGDHPAWVGTARSTFPSSTAPAIPEALTGRYAHQLEGMPEMIHALDRREGRLIRYEIEQGRWDATPWTLFDHVQAAGGATFSYFEGFFPGASITIHDELMYLLDTARVAASEDAVLSYDARMVEDATDRILALEQLPNVLFLRLGAVDAAGHFHGPESVAYRNAIAAVNTSIERILDALAATPLDDGQSAYDTAHFVLFSDHGMEQTSTHIDLDRILAAAGNRPYPTSSAAALVDTVVDRDALHDHDAVAVPVGSNLAAIYLRARGPGGALSWSKAPTADTGAALVPPLLSTPGVARVYAWTDPNTVTAFGPEGRLEIHRRFAPDGTWRLAAVPVGTPPFDLCDQVAALCCPADEPPTARCSHDLERWRQGTRHLSLPELPRLLFQPFAGTPSQRPDLLVEGEVGAGFMAETRGDHGALRPSLVQVPLLIAGPRVDPTATVTDARLVDLLPTLLDLLGVDPEQGPAPLDGEVLPVIAGGVRDGTEAGRPADGS